MIDSMRNGQLKHALPFEVRCQGCEERREHAQGRARRLAQRHGSFTLFHDAAGS